MSIHNIKFFLNKKDEIFALLSQLTSAPIIEKSEFNNIIMSLDKNHNIYIYLKDNKIVGIITLLIEQKLIHNG